MEIEEAEARDKVERCGDMRENYTGGQVPLLKHVILVCGGRAGIWGSDGKVSVKTS